MVRVLFFGRLRELAGSGERSVPLASGEGLAALRVAVAADEVELADALAAPSVRIAVNARLIAPGEDPAVEAGDEVAFMPPFSGG